ncbi:hypothetical protein, partial [Bacillus cereus group sp. BC60]|uniref:hypothetical protein n=1 Tax=Bacillus cereus group sp. BC60 TaxID=3445283 RepID=UPI003F1EAA59
RYSDELVAVATEDFLANGLAPRQQHGVQTAFGRYSDHIHRCSDGTFNFPCLSSLAATDPSLVAMNSPFFPA